MVHDVVRPRFYDLLNHGKQCLALEFDDADDRRAPSPSRRAARMS